MHVKNVLLVTFSPTRTSRCIGEAIARGTSYENIRIQDLTYEVEETPIEVPAETLLVVAVPVYGGKVAPPALKRMSGLKVAGAPAVLVALYGNRAYEQALVELESFVTGKGAQVVVAGAFVGEHSYSVEAYPVAAGRPDAQDIQMAETLNGKCRRPARPGDGYRRDAPFPDGCAGSLERGSRRSADPESRRRFMRPLWYLCRAVPYPGHSSG